MALKHAVLSLLHDRERHAYDIGRVLSHLVPGPPYNTGQIHGVLAHLEELGQVTSRYVGKGRGTVRLYRITPAGRREFERWQSAPLPPLRPLRDEILLKTMFIGRDDPQRLGVVLGDRERSLMTWLEDFDDRAVDPEACTSRTELLLALSSLLLSFRQQADRRWTVYCLQAMARLQDLPREHADANGDVPALDFTSPNAAGRPSAPGARPEAPPPRHTPGPPDRHA